MLRIIILFILQILNSHILLWWKGQGAYFSNPITFSWCRGILLICISDLEVEDMMEDEDELMDGEVEAVGKQALELVHGKLEEVVEEVDHMVLALVYTQVEEVHMV